MKLIVGLGNPGKQYEKTRHNVGFMVADALAENWRIDFKLEKKFSALIAETNKKGEKIILAKPQTFVNSSGEAIQKIANFYKIKPKDIWLVADDLELPLGKIRIRLSGSSGGHKGIESIIDGLNTISFLRIRLGIGMVKTLQNRKAFEHLPHQPILDAKEYVLEKFTKRELPVVEDVVSKVITVINEALNRSDTLKAHTLEIY